MIADGVNAWLPIGDYQVKERVVIGPAMPGVVDLAPADPVRVALLVCLRVGGGNTSISTRSNVGSGDGIPMPSTGYVELTWSKHGPLVGLPWYAFMAGLASAMTVFEIRYVGNGGR